MVRRRRDDASVVSLFPEALTLLDYINVLTGGDSALLLVLESDSAQYKDLLQSSMIVPSESSSGRRFPLPTGRESFPVKEALDRILASLVRQNQGYKEKNCFALGYSLKTEKKFSSSSMRSNHDVECTVANTVHSLVYTRRWEVLAQRVGEAILYHLLERPLFLRAKNGCYLQVSGTPASQLLYQRKLNPPKLRKIASAPVDVSLKRGSSVGSTATLLDGAVTTTTVTGKSVTSDSFAGIKGSTPLPRYQIFYRAHYQKSIGLPVYHLFSKMLSGEALQYSVFKDCQALIACSAHHSHILQSLAAMLRAADAAYKACPTHLLMELHCPIRIPQPIVPRSTPESIALNQQSPEEPPQKKTRRGRRAGRQVRQRTAGSQGDRSRSSVAATQASASLSGGDSASIAFNSRNMACYYFDDFRYRSQELTQEEEEAAARSVAEAEARATDEGKGAAATAESAAGAIDETVGRNKRKKLKRKRRQAAREVGNETSAIPPPTSKRATNRRPKGTKLPLHLPDGADLLSLSSPPKNVSDFVKAVLVRVFPYRAVWGSRRNQDCVLSAVEAYLALGRQETLTLRDVTSGIAVSDIPWLQLPVGCSASRSDAVLQQRLLSCFMLWLYSDFLHPLLAVCFYVTETGSHKFDCCYYRRPVWSLIVKKGLEQMRDNFEPLELVDCNAPALTAPIPGALFRTASNVEPRPADALLIGNKYRLRPASPPGSRSTSPLKKPKREHSAGSSSGGLSASSTSYSRVMRDRVKHDLLRIPPVRFVPKRSSVRALTNLKTTARKVGGSGGTTSGSSSSSSSASSNSSGGGAEVLTNGQLFNCLHVLRHVYLSNPLLGGFGTFGVDDIYIRFKKYLGTIKHRLPSVVPATPNVASAAATQSSAALASLPSTGGTLSALTASPLLRASQSEDAPRFYMAVLDLEKCYDNVNKEFLFDIVERILAGQPKQAAGGSAGYFTHTGGSLSSQGRSLTTDSLGCGGGGAGQVHQIHRYSVSHFVPSLDKPLTKTVRRVTATDEFLSFQEAAEEISKCYRNSVITDAVMETKLSSQELLSLLRRHLFSHVVKIPSTRRRGAAAEGGSGVASEYEFYSQVKGIPQGSVLSPLLCNIYYGHVENQVFNNEYSLAALGLADRSVIIRLSDDYVMISTERECVQYFLQTAHVNLRPYGGGVNPLKTKVNFDTSIDVNGETIPLFNVHSHLMPWCGMFINTSTLEVTPDLGRLVAPPLSRSLIVEHSKAGVALSKALKKYLRTKCDALVLDRDINRKETVLRSLYSMYLVAAMRTHHHLAKLRGVGVAVQPVFLTQCVCEGLVFGANLLHARTRRKRSKVQLFGGARQEERGSDDDDEEMDEDEGGLGSLGRAAGGEERSLFEQCLSVQTPNNFGVCDVAVNEALWLGLTAFVRVLGERRAQYAGCLRLLSARLKNVEARLTKSGKVPAATILADCEGILRSDWL